MQPALARCRSALRQRTRSAGISSASTSDFKSRGRREFRTSTTRRVESQPALLKRMPLDGGTAGAATRHLNSVWLLRQGQLHHASAGPGNVRHHGPQHFPDSGFRNFDFSVAKNWHFGERLRAAVPRRVLQHFQPSQLRQSVRRSERIWPERSFSVQPSVAVALRRTSRQPILPWVPAGPRRFRLGLKFIF